MGATYGCTCKEADMVELNQATAVDYDMTVKVPEDAEDCTRSTTMESQPTEEVICTLTKEDQAVGDHVCERLGDEAVGRFDAEDVLRKVVQTKKEAFTNDFEVSAADLAKELLETKTNTMSVSLSDPAAQDCPLVYVSPGFEYLTGYSADFCLGRSCRFLQPTCKEINDWINLDERKKMREFCVDPQKTGATIVNLIMNERFDGMRFWNLLKMMYVEVEGKQYIVGMQTNVDSFMPDGLRMRTMTSDSTANAKIFQELEMFNVNLKLLREKLELFKQSSFTELWLLASDDLNKLETHLQDEAPSKRPSVKATAAKAAAAKTTKEKKEKETQEQQKKKIDTPPKAEKPSDNKDQALLQDLLSSLGVQQKAHKGK